MQLRSTAFADGESIPAKYTADGADVSPSLSWNDVPGNVEEFALIVDDPDAPRPDPWVHWVMYRIPAQARALPEGVPTQPTYGQMVQGVNSWPRDNVGYRGPAPPKGHGLHHYHFKLYALDTQLDLQPGATKSDVVGAIEGHIIAEAQVMGRYNR